MTIRYAIPWTLLLLFGCTHTAPEYTKEEAHEMSGSTDDGADICALMGWYGDEVCDEFCVEPDPDCVDCAALLTCEPGETPVRDVSECLADAPCREVTDPGCGTTIWCSGTAECAALLTCEPGETPHLDASECPADGSCREVTDPGCGTTIWCSGVADCVAEVACAEGETLHDTASDCPQDTSCVRYTRCGRTFWCASYGTTCEGENPAGCWYTGCEAGFHCDHALGERPSACTCDLESGSWTCTADLNGGECVPD